MKCVIGVISSEGDGFESMKETWMENVQRFNASSSVDRVVLYFIEGERRNDTNLYHVEELRSNIHLFKANCEETFRNILKKTIIFFKHISEIDYNEDAEEFTFAIRSNLSTLFDFEKLFNYIREVNTAMRIKKWEYFIGGSIIDKYCALQTYFSGTNITFSIPTVKLLVQNYREVLTNTTDGDDVVMSAWLVNLCVKSLLMRDMPRLDFCEEVTFNSCDSFDNSLFCYRFKTDNRKQDALLMSNCSKLLYTGLSVKEQFVDLYQKGLFKLPGYIQVKNRGYENTFTKIFFLHVYFYRNTSVVYPEFMSV